MYTSHVGGTSTETTLCQYLGAVHSMCESLSTVYAVSAHGEPSNRQQPPLWSRSMPGRVITVPPLAGPWMGVMVSIGGYGRNRNVERSSQIKLV